MNDDTLDEPPVDDENADNGPGLSPPAPLPPAPIDVPGPSSGAPPAPQSPQVAPAAPSTAAPATTEKEPDEPWLAFAAKPAAGEPDEPWEAFGQQESWFQRQTDAEIARNRRQLTGLRNIGNAFAEGLGDGWTGGAIIAPDQPWGMTPEMKEGLDKWLAYPEVEKQQQSALKTFNEGLLFPAVKALAQAAVIQEQVIASVVQPVAQAGSALLSGALSAIIQTGEEAGQPALARDIAADIQRRAIGGGEALIPHIPGAAEGPLRVTPEPPAPEIAGAIPAPSTEPVLITPDIITRAREMGVIGPEEEWDGTSVYANIPETPDFRTIHDVAREVDPETFAEYDQLSAARDDARQRLNDEIEGLRANAENEIESNAPHTDEIADLKDTLADPRSSARSKRTAEARLPGLEAAQEAWLNDQDMYGFLTRESDETASLRREVMAADERMRDLAPKVSAAYREAETRMPPPTEVAPVDNTGAFSDQVAESTAQPEQAPQAAPEAAQPQINISAHVADQLTKAGRPTDEAQAMGALVQAYYETKADRFGGSKGTAAEIYQREAPLIQGREARGNASGAWENVNGKSVLTLFRRADATTALHEFGHQWFNDMLRDASDPQAPGSLRVDAAVVRRWLGVEEGQPLTRRHQERVARAFENYMMEGHAPSTGLARVFQQFKDWMTKVYQTVKQQNVPLNDELRGVFDRWFSTEPAERRTVVAPEREGPPPKPREIGHIMRDERVRESVARQIQSQEIIAYAEWQAANRNAGTNATPPPVSVVPTERPRTPRSEAQIMREDGVGPAEAKRRQANEFGALADWQAAQRAAGKATIEERKPATGSISTEEAQRIARDMLSPKVADKPIVPPEPIKAEPVRATKPEAGVWQHQTTEIGPVRPGDRPMWFTREGNQFYGGENAVGENGLPIRATLPAALDFKKPFVESEATPAIWDRLAARMRESGVPEDTITTFLKDKDHEFGAHMEPWLAKALKDEGYDGVIADRSWKSPWAIALDPKSQVRFTEQPEPVVAKNFGPEAKPKPQPVYVKVPREPKRLIQFLKESREAEPGVRLPGGIRDDDGDVSAIVGGPRGRPGLLNRNGASLDEAGERANEAGYFPQGRPDINELKDAIEEDHNTRPARYSMHDDRDVAAYENAVRHNREIDRLAAEHGIDPRGMTLDAFTKAVEDKVGKEQFDAQAMIERGRAIDEANELRDDLTSWQDNEIEHAGRLSPDDFERLWGEASASQELVDRQPGDGEPGVSGGLEGEGQKSEGHVGAGAGDAGSADGEGAAPAGKPESLGVTQPGPALAEQIKRRKAEIPKIGNIRLEYILDGRWDDLVSEVMSELSLSGDPRVRAGSVRTMAEHAIFNETADQFYQAKAAWQANPTDANWATLMNAKASHAAATSAWSTGLSNWAYTGHTYQRIIAANKRIEAEMKAAGDKAPPDQQTLFQRQKELSLLDQLDTPEQVGNALARDMVSRWDKTRNGLLAYYFSNILSGPITHAGYAIGGFINNVIQPLLVIPAQAAIGALRAGGSMDRVMMGEAPAFAYGLLNGTMKGVGPAMRALKTGETYLEGTGVTVPHEQMILPTLLGGNIGYALETPLRVVRMIHVLNYGMRYTAEVSRMAYRAAAKELGDANPSSSEFGAAMQRYINNIPEADMAYAHDEAIRSSLMKPPAPGSFQAGVSNLLNRAPLLRVVAPFPQIGMNLAEEGLVRTTPLGLLNANVKGDLAQGGAHFDIAAGRMAAGTGIALGVVGLTLNGLITGPGPDTSTDAGRRQMALLEAKGWAPFSVRWGDSYIPLRKALGPLGVLIATSATLANAGQAASMGQWKEAAGRIKQGFGIAVLDETWMRGVHDLFEAATNADQKLGYYLTNMAEGFIPWSQFQSQTARQIDPYVRQANGLLEHIEARTPFLSENLEPKIGPFGDPVLGHSTMGIHTAVNDPVADKMLSLGMGIAPWPNKIKDVPLSEPQKAELGTFAGHLRRQLLTPLVTAPGFSQMPVGMQIKKIDQLSSIALHAGEKTVQARNPQLILDGLAAKQKIMMQGRAALH